MQSYKLAFTAVTIVFFFSAGSSFGQGARLSPPEIYQAIPTRFDRIDDLETDNAGFENPSASEQATVTPQTDVEDQEQADWPELSSGIARSMAPGIDQRFGLASDIDLPSKFDLTAYLPTPGKQGRNDCVAWAIAYSAYSCQIGQERRKKPSDPSDLFSPAFIFNQLSVNGNPLYATQAIDFVKQNGCATKATMSSEDTTPNARALVEGKTFRMQRNEKANTLHEIETYIHEGYPVILIVRMGGDFRSDTSNDSPYDWRQESDRRDGYHAITAVGYDDSKQAVLVMNSWGTQWKDDGFCWVSYDNFDPIGGQSWCAEAHVVGVKTFAPINVSMQSSGRTRNFNRRSSRFQRRLFQLAADRRVYEGGKAISPNDWVFDDIACNKDSLFALGRYQTVFRMNEDLSGRSWTHLNHGKMANKKVTMLAGDRTTDLLALTGSNELFHYVARSGNWEPVQISETERSPVDLRLVNGKIRVTTSDGSVFVHDRDSDWSLAP
ncbi:Papain family cysteine protease [Planctomycetes bacterium CA13]|uniref:Papain family cysteine protease n=1 Tax=Novipirellula herctigrandis TaxID=2527986 RepID=A0A5C5YV21_9BACT|nr:Papain family cysteine protease [Planctomycetes bacterium CA13]